MRRKLTALMALLTLAVTGAIAPTAAAEELEATLQTALQLAACDFVAELPQGLDTVIGEEGLSLSGGQRQRVWIAMVLAQETPILLLDEPTTFLDIAHQIELLELLARLNREGRTIVAVLHDLNQACRYASHIIAMKDGAIVDQGAPSEIFTEALVEQVFGLASVIIPDPVTGTPLVVPKARAID